MQIAKNLQQSTLGNVSKSTLTSPNKGKKTPKLSNSSTNNHKPVSFSYLSQQDQQKQKTFFNTSSSTTNSNPNSVNFKNAIPNFDASFSASDDIAILPSGSSAYSDNYIIQENFSNQSSCSSWVRFRS
jgi:hypothetical protein